MRWNWLIALVAAFGAIAPAAAATNQQAWVEMAPAGGSVVRVITDGARCPAIIVDGHDIELRQRAGPADLPVRANKAGITTTTAFPGRVCETTLPRHAHKASLGDQRLPLPKEKIERIVVIGDTGCRLKASESAWQDCNSPAQWPFAAIAARAATLRPDLVLHVGDYLYRENPCPADHPGCAGTAWGYGETGWRADFLTPATPLLNTAPWIMVRGNHEECARAGQGWWRLLDPHPLNTGADCVDAANDAAGNDTVPYPVMLGGSAQIIVADLMQLASGKPGDAAVASQFADDFAQMARLSRKAKDSFVTAHYPFNPVLWASAAANAVTIGSRPISPLAPPQFQHVRAMIAGHIHLFQVAHFTDRPTQVITGFSGTQEDPALGPANLAEASGKLGSAPITALSTITGRFGYALLERRKGDWRMTVYAVDGSVMGQFSL